MMTPGRIALLVFLATVSIAVPFMMWQETWFGRTLSDRNIRKYLDDAKRPRRAQHALSQISERILGGDPAARKWYPDVIASSRHADPRVRLTAAWVMGHDNRAGEFHAALTQLLSDKDAMVRRNAALSLVRFGDASGRPEFIAMLTPGAIRAPASGAVAETAEPGQTVTAGTLLARVAGRDVRTPYSTRVMSVKTERGMHVAAGQEIMSVEAGPDQVWEALRALYLVGRVEDLPYVERFTQSGDRIAEQAVKTAAAIRLRGAGSQPASTRTGPEPSPTR
jgi:hypothetical protein